MTENNKLPKSCLLALEVERFAKTYALSTRESEIVGQIIGGTKTIELIAKNIGTSPNTVSNQLQSIFRKTKCHSQIEILCSFIESSFKSFSNVALFSRVPRILVVDDEPDIVDILVEVLKDKGFEAFGYVKVEQAFELVFEYNPDVVISDIQMPGMTGYEFLEKLRRTYRFHPHVLFITGYTPKPIPELLAMGAAGVFSKPIDFDLMVSNVVELCASNEFHRRQLTRTKFLGSLKYNESLLLKFEDIGFGGAFINLENEKKHALDFFSNGKIFSLQFSFPDSNVQHEVKAEVVWSRNSSDQFGPLGIGVKFVEISGPTSEKIRDFVRKNNIKSFIPLGSGYSPTRNNVAAKD